MSESDQAPEKKTKTTGGIKKLAELLAHLQQEGADAERLRAVQCALSFKRSWIDLAEALSAIRKSGCYERWGYKDMMAYASAELGLRSATVDKLLVSYATLNRHAPARLKGNDDIPSYQALDYLARATGEMRATGKPPRDAPDAPPSDKVLRELHSAVFEEGQSARQLRDRFDPILRPRSPEQQQQIALRRLSSAAQRLLLQLEEVEDLQTLPVPKLKNLLETVRAQTEALTEQLREITPAAA